MRKFCARLSRSYLSFCQQNNLRQQSSAYDFTTRNQFTKVENNDDFPFIDYYAFSKWYIKFLISELRPTASYQRHITALKILASIVMDGTFKTNHDMLFDPANIVDEALVRDEQFLRLGCVRLILDLVMDPFDDVRHTATTLFELVLWNQQPSSIAFCYENIPTQSLNKNFAHVKTVSRQAYQPFLIHVLTRAEATMFHTGRADHADGVGRLYYLLYNTFMGSGKLILTESETGTSLFVVDQILSELEKNIGVANRDLRLAVQEAPLHGSFIALR